MVAGAVRVAGDREAADDRAVVLGDVDGRVGMAAQRAQVAALLADGAPAVRVQQPRLRLAADRGAERDERRRVLRPRLADRRPSSDDDAVAAAARVAGGGERAVGPALDRRDAAEVEVAARPAHGLPALGRDVGISPPSRWSTSPSTWTRGRSIASSTGVPRRTASATWAIAPARRTEPALPSASRGRPSSSTSVGVIMLGSRSPGAFGGVADDVELAEHVVQLRAAAEDARAGAERRGERGGVAVGVDARRCASCPRRASGGAAA